MTLASTSRVQLRYIKETLFGVTPTIGLASNIRMTGESFNFAVTKEVSDEINADRASSSMIATSAEASGTMNAELSYAEYDDLLSAVMQNPWANFGTGGVSTAFEVAATATTLTATVAPSGTSAFTLLKAGQWFTLAGVPAGNPNLNKLFRVSATVAPTSTVITLDPGTPATVSAATAGAVIRNSRLTNGVTQPSFTFERYSSDTEEYFAYLGMTASKFNLSMSSGSRTTIDFDFMGRTSVRGANVTTLPASPNPSKAYDIMSGVSGTTCALWVGGAPLTSTFINSLSLSYDNALRVQNAMCNLGAVAIGSGTIVCTASVELYFASGAKFYSEFLNNSNLEIVFTTFDNSGNGYVWTLPKANVSSYTSNAGGKDADLLVTIELTALLDSANADVTKRKVLFIDRAGAAVV